MPVEHWADNLLPLAASVGWAVGLAVGGYKFYQDQILVKRHAKLGLPDRPHDEQTGVVEDLKLRLAPGLRCSRCGSDQLYTPTPDTPVAVYYPYKCASCNADLSRFATKLQYGICAAVMAATISVFLVIVVFGKPVPDPPPNQGLKIAFGVLVALVFFYGLVQKALCPSVIKSK